MFHFRLHVFNSAANHLSFTKAAEELYITQPAVTKNIKELESALRIDLFNRSKSGISLTKAGVLLKKYTDILIEQERELEYKLSELRDSLSGELRLGASTTIGQYIIPRILGEFASKNTEVNISLINHNSQEIIERVLSKDIDLGVVEGSSKFKELKYIPFMEDEIVAIAHTSQSVSQCEQFPIGDLVSKPLVLREVGSGSLEVIAAKLHKYRIGLKDLNVKMHLGSTESIKTFLRSNNCLGFVSAHAVEREVEQGEFKIIRIDGLEIKRTFNFIYPQGQQQGLVDRFIEFAILSNQ